MEMPAMHVSWLDESSKYEKKKEKKSKKKKSVKKKPSAQQVTDRNENGHMEEIQLFKRDVPISITPAS